jgi:hypothetical protein
VAAFTISADPIFIKPKPALYHRVPPAPGFTADEVKVMDFAPDKLFVSSINMLESCTMPTRVLLDPIMVPNDVLPARKLLWVVSA